MCKKKNGMTSSPPPPSPDLAGTATMLEDKKCMNLNEKKGFSVSNEKNISSYWSDDELDISSSRPTRTLLTTENLANMDMLDQDISTIETCHCPRSLQDELEPIVNEKECTLPHDVVVLFLVHAMQESDYFQREPTSTSHVTFDPSVY